MLTSEPSNMDHVFQALSHPIRRALLESLAEGPETIVNLAQPFGVSLNAISKHVKSLESAGLVERTRDRTYHRLTLRPEGLRPALSWMEHYAAFWTQNLASLKRSLESE